MAEQDFVLTLPASFDEVARELTVKAAALAGLPRVVLIEEPQAAFYAWIYAHANDWDRLVQPGQKILVCDIGGGTSDFTLDPCSPRRRRQVQFHRVAVGDHLILGGDNLDLALAHHLERRLTQGDGGLSPFSPQRGGESEEGPKAEMGTVPLASASPSPSPVDTSGERRGGLEPRRWAMLVESCRRLKETLLGPARRSE